jgi:hypothetical protein
MTCKLTSGISFPFYLLEPGKPDPNVYWERGEERPRIEQSPQKGPTCWYYAMNLLRERIGKLFSPECQKAREIEEKCSLLRKNITHLENERELIVQFLESANENPNHKWAWRILPALERRVIIESEKKDLSPEDIEEMKTLIHRIQRFCAQMRSDDLSEYFLNYYKKEYCRIQYQFIKTMGFDPAVMYKNLRKKQLLNLFKKTYANSRISFDKTKESMLDLAFHKWCRPWKSLPVTDRCTLFSKFLSSVLLQVYGFKAAKWNPDKSIDEFIDTLKTHGPLLMTGTLGTPFHEKPPEKTREVGGRNIYGWREEDAEMLWTKLGRPVSHFVVVIGAEKEGSTEGSIYFVDPNDGSSPNNPELQRIYVTSYRNFQEQIYRSSKIPCTQQSGYQLSSSSSSFFHHAFYRPLEDQASSHSQK